jgi:hypothetical protein
MEENVPTNIISDRTHINNNKAGNDYHKKDNAIPYKVELYHQ